MPPVNREDKTTTNQPHLSPVEVDGDIYYDTNEELGSNLAIKEIGRRQVSTSYHPEGEGREFRITRDASDNYLPTIVSYPARSSALNPTPTSPTNYIIDSRPGGGAVGPETEITINGQTIQLNVPDEIRHEAMVGPNRFQIFKNAGADEAFISRIDSSGDRTISSITMQDGLVEDVRFYNSNRDTYSTYNEYSANNYQINLPSGPLPPRVINGFNTTTTTTTPTNTTTISVITTTGTITTYTTDSTGTITSTTTSSTNTPPSSTTFTVATTSTNSTGSSTTSTSTFSTSSLSTETTDPTSITITTPTTTIPSTTATTTLIATTPSASPTSSTQTASRTFTFTPSGTLTSTTITPTTTREITSPTTYTPTITTTYTDGTTTTQPATPTEIRTTTASTSQAQPNDTTTQTATEGDLDPSGSGDSNEEETTTPEQIDDTSSSTSIFVTPGLETSTTTSSQFVTPRSITSTTTSSQRITNVTNPVVGENNNRTAGIGGGWWTAIGIGTLATLIGGYFLYKRRNREQVAAENLNEISLGPPAHLQNGPGSVKINNWVSPEDNPTTQETAFPSSFNEIKTNIKMKVEGVERNATVGDLIKSVELYEGSLQGENTPLRDEQLDVIRALASASRDHFLDSTTAEKIYDQHIEPNSTMNLENNKIREEFLNHYQDMQRAAAANISPERRPRGATSSELDTLVTHHPRDEGRGPPSGRTTPTDSKSLSGSEHKHESHI